MDSDYSLLLSYTPQEGNILYYAPAGDSYYAPVQWLRGGKVSLFIGGKQRELSPVESTKGMYDWLAEKSFEVKSATEHYTLQSPLDIEADLYLDSDYSFQYSFGVSAPIVGKAAMTHDGKTLVLYHSEGTSADVWRMSSGSLYAGASPMKADGELVATKSYHNTHLGQESGYVLDGTVYLDEGAVYFTFTEDSRCVKSVQGGASIEYSYYVDTDGLITLGASGGATHDDYLYYDAEYNCIYRLVFKRDTWFDFVADLGAQLTDSMGNTEGANVSCTGSPKVDPYSELAVAYPTENSILYEGLSGIDSSYTEETAEELQELWAKIAADDKARQEYELSLLSEREQLFKRAQALEEAQAQLKALMDARVQVEIESGKVTKPTTNKDDTWLDQILSSIENQGGYDQGASSSGPVVNIGGEGEVPEPSNAPDPAAPTEPNPPNSGEPETTTPEYNPVFHVDFVCTCVNCYTQSLPVELNADNVLLVDASIIVPGTLVNLEGFGVVTACESGGITSGQTAVCYSKSHNAVIRFSSGTYNVYPVVG